MSFYGGLRLSVEVEVDSSSPETNSILHGMRPSLVSLIISND